MVCDTNILAFSATRLTSKHDAINGHMSPKSKQILGPMDFGTTYKCHLFPEQMLPYLYHFSIDKKIHLWQHYHPPHPDKDHSCVGSIICIITKFPVFKVVLLSILTPDSNV